MNKMGYSCLLRCITARGSGAGLGPTKIKAHKSWACLIISDYLSVVSKTPFEGLLSSNQK